MKKVLSLVAVMAMALLPVAGWAQSSACDSITLPYYENFTSDDGTLPECWTYDGTYVKWNNWPATSGNGELMFGANSGSKPAVLPYLNNALQKTGITFKAKCGTIEEGDAILIGAADSDGNLLEWIDTIFDADHSRNAWVTHTYNFIRYTGYGTRIALGRLWNTYDGAYWVAIDDIEVTNLPSCYPPDSLKVHHVDDPAYTSFTWVNYGNATQWQVYCDTITTNIDDVDESLFTIVETTEYMIPEGTITGGGKYRFHVRAMCDEGDYSPWITYEFGAGTYVMNNTGILDAVTACGLVVYDNGGPIAGYAENSNSAMVIYPEGVGNQLQVVGGMFGFGSTGATLTIYDGVGTSGTALYTYNTTSGRDTIDSLLCTSTLGALTIKFNSTGNMCHTGYELYVRCTQEPSCPRPSYLSAEFPATGKVRLSWQGEAPTYKVFHRRKGVGAWSMHTLDSTSITLTGLTLDTRYEAYVLAVCDAGDTSRRSVLLEFRTPDTDIDPDCSPVSNLHVDNVNLTSARVGWDSDGTRWTVEYDGMSFTTSSNPITLTDLAPETTYSVRVRNVCTAGYSPWSEPVSFFTKEPTGIDAVEVGNISVAPNPASNKVVVSGMTGEWTMNVYDLSGRLRICSAGSSDQMQMDVSGFEPGVYIISLIMSDGTASKRLLVW